MRDKDKSAVLNRIEKIAQKVYRQHENSVYMLINDLEDFFEINDEITDYITDPSTYTVDTEWDLTTGNITVFKDNKSVTLKIGI